MTSHQSGSPADTSASLQCHNNIAHRSDNPESFVVNGDCDSSPCFTYPMLYASPPRLTSHLQVVPSASPNKTAVEKAVTSDKSASIPQPLMTCSPPTSTLTINPGSDIHLHYTPLVVTDFLSECTCHGGQDNFTHHDSYKC